MRNQVRLTAVILSLTLTILFLFITVMGIYGLKMMDSKDRSSAVIPIMFIVFSTCAMFGYSIYAIVRYTYTAKVMKYGKKVLVEFHLMKNQVEDILPIVIWLYPIGENLE